MSAIVVTGDAQHLALPSESVDVVVTSPPYFSMRRYSDGDRVLDDQIGMEATPAAYIANLIACTREMARVLKPSGSIFVNLGDKYNSAASGQNGTGSTGMTGGRHDRMGGRGIVVKGMPTKSLMLLPERYRLACLDDLGLVVRAVVLWSKPNAIPDSARDRVRRAHEDWVHLTKSPRYYSNTAAIREASRTGGADRVPGSVWEVASHPLRVPAGVGAAHYAPFPVELPRRLISGWCPPGGVVLDPFGGTGTTALVADALGRVGISVDASSDYGRIAAWRCADPKQRARVQGVNAVERAS